jgi:hypothetical protein
MCGSVGRLFLFLFFSEPAMCEPRVQCAQNCQSVAETISSTHLSRQAMTDENEFQPRPGRIRSSRAQRAKPFIAQALAAAQRAGGGVSRLGLLRSRKRSTFGRGRVASVRARRLLTGRSQLVTIRTRVVRRVGRTAPLSAHLDYLRREGVTRDGAKAPPISSARIGP